MRIEDINMTYFYDSNLWTPAYSKGMTSLQCQTAVQPAHPKLGLATTHTLPA